MWFLAGEFNGLSLYWVFSRDYLSINVCDHRPANHP
jgi:hypothetical protein